MMSTGVPLSVLPADPVNQTSTNLYYTYSTDGTTFKIMAMPESDKYVAETGKNSDLFTSGSNLGLDGGSWILAPGNPTFGTPNFYVMKYEADCSDGKGQFVNEPATPYNGYDWLTTPCTSDNGLQVAALPGGIPIVYIVQSQAASACQAIGAHLMTNNEYQTIAWNAEGDGSNWSGGSVGIGRMYVGHDDALPERLIEPASSNDTQGYFGTDGLLQGAARGAMLLSAAYLRCRMAA